MGAPGTPGPWLIHAVHRWIVPAKDAFKEYADALPICQLRDPDERLTEDETLDNGFLIAAAPDLYDALEDLRAFVAIMVGLGSNAVIPETIRSPLGAPVKIGAIMRDAAASLAKARGEQ